MSFNFGVFSNSDSQDSELEEQDLQNLVEGSKAKNTIRCTNWGMKKFFSWITKRNKKVDLKTVPMEELNELLRKFYAEVKTEKKTMLTPSALTGIRAALHRSLIASPYERKFNIISDREFTTANEMFNARCKLYCKSNNVKAKHKAAIEQEDMLRLRDYFKDLEQNPTKLQEYIWFSLCFHFGRRGREGWRELEKDFFMIKNDASNKRFVTMVVTERTKNNAGGNKQIDQDYSDIRMYEVNNDKLDPVALFEFYLSKLNPDNCALFQKSKKNYSINDDVWYSKEVVGKNTLSSIMKNISQKAGLSQVYTNHCVRASTVTTLYRAGIDTRQICSITKHKNEDTLTHYISSSSDAQKQKASSVLSMALMGDSNETPVDCVQSASEVTDVVSKMKSANLLQNILTNAEFHNSVTINFYGQSSKM